VIKFLEVHYTVDFSELEVIILLGKNNFKMKEVFSQMRERQVGDFINPSLERTLLDYKSFTINDHGYAKVEKSN
jgi:Zn-dependent M16 (insulinase) family peptidase